MEMTTSWFKHGEKIGEHRGEQRGLLEGKAELLYSQISYRFGPDADDISSNIP